MKPCFTMLVVPLALAMAACGNSSERRMSARDETAVATIPVGADPSGGDASFAQALMLLPVEAGAVTRIRERHYVNGSRQDIVVGWDPATKSENVLEVSVETAPAQPGSGFLQIGKPSERGIQSEILSRFPGMAMNIVTRPMQNAYGTFGLAIGRQASNRCIFAWQWIDDLRASGANRSSFSRLGSAFSGRGTPVSIRVRLCSPSKTVDQLASHMEALQMGEPDAMGRILTMDRKSIEPLAAVGSVPVGRGIALAPGAPATTPVTAAGSLESALGGGPAQPRMQTASRPRPANRVVRRQKPADDESSREAARPAVQPPPAMTVAPQQPTGPRYLAPVPQQMGGISASAVPAQQRLNSSLPSQAYRGPTSQEPYRPPNLRQ